MVKRGANTNSKAGSKKAKTADAQVGSFEEEEIDTSASGKTVLPL